MTLFQLVAILLVLTAGYSYLNERFLRLPSTIGVMLIALSVSLVFVVLDWAGLHSIHQVAHSFLEGINFKDTLLNGMLCFLLFAGAIHVPLRQLEREKWFVCVLAIVSTVIATAITGTLTWYALHWAGIDISYIHALIFGALISPTDPVSVLGILKRAGIPRHLETLISGESLFNDGVGVVLFTILTGIAMSGQMPEMPRVGVLFAREVMGGGLLGLAAGYLTFLLARSTKQFPTLVLIFLAAVMGMYTLAVTLGVSGPITVVVAGLLLGNRSHQVSTSPSEREHMNGMWRLIDEVLNAILFVMIGIVLIGVPLIPGVYRVALLAIVIVLFSRFASVSAPVLLFRMKHRYHSSNFKLIQLLTWGGLRGGISIALAMSLSPGPEKDVILALTYGVVAFAILVQGTTVGRLFSRPELKEMSKGI